MFRFFRSIRQSLLAENKTLKYLKYAVGEVLLVVIGILIALQTNTWNQNRLLRTEERETVSRILVDLGKDLETFIRVKRTLERKETSLLNLEKAFSSGEVADIENFFDDIYRGALYGWSQRVANRSTYDDLLGSGNLGIVRDSEVRVNISDYYHFFAEQHGRIDERESSFPSLSYQFVPNGLLDRLGSDDDGETPVLDLSDEEAKDLIQTILNSPIRDHITAEINFGEFTEISFSEIQQRAQKLNEILLSYQKEIQN